MVGASKCVHIQHLVHRLAHATLDIHCQDQYAQQSTTVGLIMVGALMFAYSLGRGYLLARATQDICHPAKHALQSTTARQTTVGASKCVFLLVQEHHAVNAILAMCLRALRVHQLIIAP